MQIIDISMKIDEDTIYYPGNPQPEIEKYREIPEDSTTESRICIGSHTGSHVDASSHVREDGETVDDMDLDGFYGETQVLDIEDEEKISVDELKEKEINSDIVLFKTLNSRNRDNDSFDRDFVYLSLEAVEYLVGEGVETVGIDYLSLVKFDGGESASKAHKLANDEMTVIEGLKLDGVEPGSYIFSGFPVKVEADGSPLRAVLIDK